MNNTMILNDGTALEFIAGASLTDLKIQTADHDGMLAVWKLMTEDNLSSVQFLNADGLVVGNYKDLLLVSETSVVNSDGTITTSYQFREKTDEEKRLDALEEGQEVQDGAIADLGAVASVLAEAVEMEGA